MWMNETAFPLCIVHRTTITLSPAYSTHTLRARFVSEPFKKRMSWRKKNEFRESWSRKVFFYLFPSSCHLWFVCSGFSVDLFTLPQQAIERFSFSFRWMVFISCMKNLQTIENALLLLLWICGIMRI